VLQCLICYLIEGNQTVEASLVRSMSVLRKYARLCHIPFLYYIYYRTGAPIFEYRNHLARSIHVTEVPADIEFSWGIKVTTCQGLKGSLAQIQMVFVA